MLNCLLLLLVVSFLLRSVKCIIALFYSFLLNCFEVFFVVLEVFLC